MQGPLGELDMGVQTPKPVVTRRTDRLAHQSLNTDRSGLGTRTQIPSKSKGRLMRRPRKACGTRHPGMPRVACPTGTSGIQDGPREGGG